MTKSTAFLLCLACLIFGFVSGQNSMTDEKPETNAVAYETLLTDMTSDGRRIMLDMKDDLLRSESPLIADAFFAQTRALRLMTQTIPDKAAAHHSLREFRASLDKVRRHADAALLDALEKMPASDRDVYLKHHLKNKKYLMNLLIVQPLMTDVKTVKKDDPRPRDQILQSTKIFD